MAPANSAEPREYLKEDSRKTVSAILERFDKYLLEGNRLELLLSDAKLHDTIKSLSILIEKLQLLDGQPTQIIGAREHKKLDELGPALLAEISRRKALAKQTEITVSA